MPRYLVERNFPNGLDIPVNAEGRKAMDGVIANNAEYGVTWVHSYVTPERTQTFCIYDAPSPDAVRKAAERNDLPVGRILQVSVLDPYSYGT
jgi:Nickel responsive protein SCO4226-like